MLKIFSLQWRAIVQGPPVRGKPVAKVQAGLSWRPQSDEIRKEDSFILSMLSPPAVRHYNVEANSTNVVKAKPCGEHARANMIQYE
ncbi:jg14407 [Pararge aegeria aegeria]|uniref:Jg14407 protein n=1 Tax=Pararge aegeria aegeria TaxID=348720 RepID=A0A8S4S0Z6_9NEOP|nr:jg14407 [Pararge aegeria aegeria]